VSGQGYGAHERRIAALGGAAPRRAVALLCNLFVASATSSLFFQTLICLAAYPVSLLPFAIFNFDCLTFKSTRYESLISCSI